MSSSHNLQIQTFKEYFLRYDEIWDIIKPHLILLMVNDWRREYLNTQKTISDQKLRVNQLQSGGIDSSEQKFVDFLKESISDKILTNSEALKPLERQIEIWGDYLLTGKLFPSYSIHFLDNQKDVRLTFEIIEGGNDSLQVACLRTIRLLLFGTLIDGKKAELKNLRIKLSEKHLRDLRIHLQEIKKPEMDREMQRTLNDSKASMIEMGSSKNDIKELFYDEIFDLNHIYNWYGINSSFGTEALKNKIVSNINDLKNKQKTLLSEINFLTNLIADFEAYNQEWISGWKDIKIPDEDDLF